MHKIELVLSFLHYTQLPTFENEKQGSRESEVLRRGCRICKGVGSGEWVSPSQLASGSG